MATKRKPWSEWSLAEVLAADDTLLVLDKSDTTDAPEGTVKQLPFSMLRSALTYVGVNVIENESYTITAADAGHLLWFAAGCDVGVDAGLPVGFQCACVRGTAGEVSFLSDDIRSRGDLRAIAEQYDPVTLVKVEEGVVWLGGVLA